MLSRGAQLGWDLPIPSVSGSPLAFLAQVPVNLESSCLPQTLPLIDLDEMLLGLLSQTMHPCFASCCCCLVTQSCPTLCKPMDWRPLGSSVHRIFQARILEWGDISSSMAFSWPRDQRLNMLLLGLLHCRQRTIYLLSHLGSPFVFLKELIYLFHWSLSPTTSSLTK